MLIQEIIRAKRDGRDLAKAEIQSLVAGISAGTVSDEQLGAFAMAVFLNGMSDHETACLTLAMRDSGRVLSWDGSTPGPLLDKHSTGGVGDGTSLLVGPWLAACGAGVPMIAGRGLGHTGGTIDKLESIPGYQPSVDPATFQRVVRREGVAIVGQTRDLAPADRRLYAVRDVTATVECLPLIVASILSKKLAEGLDGLVMDIKTGNGAVMPDPARARELALAITRVASEAGTPTTALISDMDQPLARNAGNALEVREIVEILTGRRPGGRLLELSRELAARLLLSSGMETEPGAADRRLEEAWQRGEVAERFSRMVHAMGGPANLLEKYPDLLPAAPVVIAVRPTRAGFVKRIDVRALGLAVVELGGGRRRAADTIDPAVGLESIAGIGEPVDAQHPLLHIHAANAHNASQISAQVQQAFEIGDKEQAPPPLIREWVQL
jgi:thymidine phosphorylase